MHVVHQAIHVSTMHGRYLSSYINHAGYRDRSIANENPRTPNGTQSRY